MQVYVELNVECKRDKRKTDKTCTRKLYIGFSP